MGIETHDIYSEVEPTAYDAAQEERRAQQAKWMDTRSNGVWEIVGYKQDPDVLKWRTTQERSDAFRANVNARNLEIAAQLWKPEHKDWPPAAWTEAEWAVVDEMRGWFDQVI